MPELYAACRRSGGPLVVKRVLLAPNLQAMIPNYFAVQDAAFRAGINTVIEFTGDWKPDDDELLCLRSLAEPALLLSAASQNAVTLPVLNAANFQAEGVRALFVEVDPGPNRRLLLQNFQPAQILSTRFTMLFDGNTFRQVTEPSFSLERQLVGYIDAAGILMFKSYQMIRRVFDLSNTYRTATDDEVTTFCRHASLAVADPIAFLAGADEGIRKAVHALTKANVLGTISVDHIQAQAAAIGFTVNVVGGCIEVPTDRRRTKALLSFLLDKVYRGSFDPRLFITNSNRLF